MIGRKQVHIIFASTLLFGCINNVEQIDPKFSAVAVPEYAGSVSPSNGSIIPTDSINLTAIPNLGYAFDFWNQNPSDTLNPKPFTFEENTEVTANFEFNGFLRAYGGISFRRPLKFLLKDNQLFLSGIFSSGNGVFTGFHRGSSDVFMGVFDSSENFEVLTSLGGSFSDDPTDFYLDSNNDLIMVGRTRSTDGNIPIQPGNGVDIFISRIDLEGNILWSKVLGGVGSDIVSSVKSYQNGYLLAGNSDTKNGFLSIPDSLKGTVAVIIKLSNDGAVEWHELFDGSGEEIIDHVQVLSDGSIIAIGRTSSSDGFFTDSEVVLIKPFVMKLSSNREVEWITYLTDEDESHMRDTYLVNDQTMIFAGVFKIDSDIHDMVVIKLDLNTGTILWEKTHGGTSDDLAYAVEVTEHGDIYIGGTTLSQDGIFSEARDPFSTDAFILKLSPLGDVQSVFLLEGNLSDFLYDIHIKDELIFYYGHTSSNEWDFSFRNPPVTTRDMFIGVKELKDFDD